MHRSQDILRAQFSANNSYTLDQEFDFLYSNLHIYYCQVIKNRKICILLICFLLKPHSGVVFGATLREREIYLAVFLLERPHDLCASTFKSPSRVKLKESLRQPSYITSRTLNFRTKRKLKRTTRVRVLKEHSFNEVIQIAF